MNRRLIFSLALAAAVTAFGAPQAVNAPSDDEVKAQASAREVAGAFSNDGFKTRDGHTFGQVAPKEAKCIQVNLYAGNQYWFIAAAAAPAKRIVVSVYDEHGKLVPTELYENNAQAAAGFSPRASGPYIVRIQEIEGEPAAFCLLYSYK